MRGCGCLCHVKGERRLDRDGGGSRDGGRPIHAAIASRSDEAMAALRERLPLARERELGSIIIALGMYSVAGIGAREGQVGGAGAVQGGRCGPVSRRWLPR